MSDQVAASTSQLPSESSWALPELSGRNVTCKLFCNDEELEESLLEVAGEAKSCVGAFKVSRPWQDT